MESSIEHAESRAHEEKTADGATDTHRGWHVVLVKGLEGLDEVGVSQDLCSRASIAPWFKVYALVLWLVKFDLSL